MRKPKYPRACSYYIPVSDENYERAFRWNEGLCEPIWTACRQVVVGGVKIDKSRMDIPNDVDYERVEAMIEHFDRAIWDPIRLDHEGYLLDGQHRLQVCRRKGLLLVDAVVRCPDYKRIEDEEQERLAREKKDRRYKRQG